MNQREAKIPADDKQNIKAALERIVQLYNTTAQPAQAAVWQQKLLEFIKSAKP